MRQIEQLRSAIADGPHVELHRLSQICAVWGYNISHLTKDQKAHLAMRFEVELYNAAGGAAGHENSNILEFGDQQKIELCSHLSTFVAKELGVAEISSNLILECIARSISALIYREAWIYRDWQDAIGDAMLESDASPARRFKVIGYEKFEKIIQENNQWMMALRTMIDDIDLARRNPNDFRIKQLADISAAAAGLVVAFCETDDADLVEQELLGVAQAVLHASTQNPGNIP